MPEQARDRPNTQEDDAALVARIRAGGDRAAWSALLTRYQDRLYAVCLRMVGNPDTAAELCQDALVKVIQGLESYEEKSRLSTWMIRVTMNTCLSHLRAAKLRKHQSLEARAARGAEFSDAVRGTGGSDREPGPVSRVEQGELQRRLGAAMGRLDVDQRAILVLRDVRGLDYGQIGEVLGLAEGTVKSRLFRARTALREAMEAGEAG